MNWIRAIVSLVPAAAVFWGLDNRHGTFPALDKLINPFAGFWQMAFACLNTAGRISEVVGPVGLRQDHSGHAGYAVWAFVKKSTEKRTSHEHE